MIEARCQKVFIDTARQPMDCIEIRDRGAGPMSFEFGESISCGRKAHKITIIGLEVAVG